MLIIGDYLTSKCHCIAQLGANTFSFLLTFFVQLEGLSYSRQLVTMVYEYVFTSSKGGTSLTMVVFTA